MTLWSFLDCRVNFSVVADVLVVSCFCSMATATQTLLNWLVDSERDPWRLFFIAAVDFLFVRMEIKCNTMMRFLCGQIRGDPLARFCFHFNVEIVDSLFFFISTFKSDQIVFFSSVWSRCLFSSVGADVCV